MTVTTTLLINGTALFDVFVVLTDVASPPQMSCKTSVVVRPVQGVVPPSVAIFSSALQMDPDELAAMQLGADELANKAYSRG